MNGWGLAIEFLDPPETGIVIQLAKDALEGEDFFGAGHYVEVGDQRFGRYDGIVAVVVSADRLACDFELGFEVPPWGSQIQLTFDEPLSDFDVSYLKQIKNEKDR